MTFTLRALKAKHGDSLLLFSDRTRVLIDGGPSRVYEDFLRPELEKLQAQENDEPAKIDLMVISHIDADHIVGILDLTEEMIEDRDERRQSVVEIRRAWHNSFSDMIKGVIFDDELPVRDQSGRAAGILDDLIQQNVKVHDSSLVMASVNQGRRLRQDLKTLNIKTNGGFPDGLVKPLPDYAPWKKRNLSLTVIGPTDEEVRDLRDKWKKELPKLLAKESAAETAGAAVKLDKSISNIASIVFVAEVQGKRMLLTGDARHDKIVEWLNQAGMLDADGCAHFDVIKQAHHGATGNASLEFFQKITADHYVVSGNGGHGNPEPLVFEWLLEARPDRNYQIHMTYGPAELAKNKSYIKYENDKKLTELLADPANTQNQNGNPLFIWPSDGEIYVDVVL